MPTGYPATADRERLRRSDVRWPQRATARRVPGPVTNPRKNRVVAVFCCAAGAASALAVYAHPEKLHAPAWVAHAACFAFALAGLAILTEEFQAGSLNRLVAAGLRHNKAPQVVAANARRSTRLHRQARPQLCEAETLFERRSQPRQSKHSSCKNESVAAKPAASTVWKIDEWLRTGSRKQR